jgi:hypothetical protein
MSHTTVTSTLKELSARPQDVHLNYIVAYRNVNDHMHILSMASQGYLKKRRTL